MEKTKIDWADSSWNPVTGCYHECQYCYARKMASRFGSHQKTDAKTVVLDEPFRIDDGRTPYPYDFVPTFHRYRLSELASKKYGKTIFVCSMADLFGDWVSDEWISEVFDACINNDNHRYLFLTKNPSRYTDLAEKRLLPKRDNMWYGSSVTDPDMPFFYSDAVGGYNTFLSIEPLLAPFPAEQFDIENKVKWIIIGAESGNRTDKVVPQKEWINDICKVADGKVAVFFKDSLIPIVGEENMRREFPWVKGEI